jgi:hypothetical protein
MYKVGKSSNHELFSSFKVINSLNMTLPIHLEQELPFLVSTEITLLILEVFVLKIPYCYIVPSLLLNTLVLQERLISKVLETSFRLLSISNMCFGHLKGATWIRNGHFRFWYLTN